MSRHRAIELRRRVERLHRQLDGAGGVVPSEFAAPADSHTVAAVATALRRRGISDRARGALTVSESASRVAAWAKDPSITVRADFAADRHAVEAFRAAVALDDGVRRTWKNGMPVGSDEPPLRNLDAIAGLRLRTRNLLAVADAAQVIPSTWTPAETASMGWHADALRPPAEAIAAATRLVGDEAETVLAIDLGHEQALCVASRLLPFATLVAVGTAYGPPPISAGPVDAVIVNLSAEAVRRWAHEITHPALDHGVHVARLRALRDCGRTIDPEAGLGEVLDPVLQVLTESAQVALVVLGDVRPDRHHRALRWLRNRGVRLDAQAGGVYVQAPSPGTLAAWRPAGVPPITGRLVSAWRATR